MTKAAQRAVVWVFCGFLALFGLLHLLLPRRFLRGLLEW